MMPSDPVASDHAASYKAAEQVEQANTSRPTRPEAPPGEEMIVDGEAKATDDKEPGTAASSDEKEDVNAGDQLPAKLVALIMAALSLAVLLSALDTTILVVALPVISHHFNSVAAYAWTGSAYILANAAAGPLWAKLADLFGRKPLLLIANFVFFIGSLITALSINVHQLLAGRAIQGAGGGGLLTLVDIIISDLFSQRTRGKYLGVIGGVWAVACGIGPILGGVFTSRATWRWCFYLNLPLSGISFVISVFFLKLKTPRTPLIKGLLAVDWLGGLTSAGGSVMLLLGLQYGGQNFPWSSATVICLIIFGIVTLAVFVVIEWRFARFPVMPLALYASRSNAAVYFVTFLFGYAFLPAFYYLPLYFQAVKGATPLLAGVWILPSALACGIVSFLSGGIIAASGQYIPLILGGFGLFTLGCGLYIDFDVSSGWAKIIIYQLIIGTGLASLFFAPLVALQRMVAQRDIATATSTYNVLRQLGSAVGVIVGQVVFASQMRRQVDTLAQTLPAYAVAALGNGDALANVDIVNSLPPAAKTVARVAISNALRRVWIMNTVFAGVSLAVSLLIAKDDLSRSHRLAEFGLPAEERNAAARRGEKTDKPIEM